MYILLSTTTIIIVAVIVVFIFLVISCQVVLRSKDDDEDEESSDDSGNSTTNIISENKIVIETTDEADSISNPISSDEVDAQTTLESPKEEVFENETSNKRKGKYEVFKEGEFFRYRLKAANGEVLIESDLYQTEVLAIDQVEIVKRNCENGEFKVYEGANGSFYYKLSSKNHRTLVTSSQFQTKKAAEDALGAFRRNAVTDVTVILTTEESSQSTMEQFVDNTQGTDSNGSYEVVPSGKKFYFVLRSQSGSTLCISPDYVSKTSCITALQQFRQLAYDGTFYICQDKNDKYQFKLYNKQNKVVMVGDLQSSKTRVQNMIKLIKRYALLSEIK